MAITILQTPSNGQPISRPLLHYVSSNQTSYSDFRYIFEVYYFPYSGIPGVPVKIGKFKVVPDATYSRGLIDVSKIIKNYIGTSFKPTQDLLSWTTNNINVNYKIIFAEYYNGADHYDTFPPHSEASAYYLWSDIINALPLSVYPTGYQWLTDRDTTRLKVPRGRNLFLPVNNSVFGTTYTGQRISITSDNGSGGWGHNFDKVDNKQALILNLNSDIIKSAFIDEAGEDLDALIPNWYIDQIQVQNSFSYGTVKTTIGKLFYTYPKISTLQLHFLNRYGVFETFSFDAVNRQSDAVERKSYKKTGVNLSSASVNEFDYFDNGASNGETYVFAQKETNFYTKQDFSYKLISDYVNEQDYNWLKQLVASPLVYTDVPISASTDASVYYPVQIKTAQWEQKYSGADKVFNLELEINVGQIIL